MKLQETLTRGYSLKDINTNSKFYKFSINFYIY